jgi:hypothetical protein
MRWYSRILSISCIEHVTNNEVSHTIQQLIGQTKGLLIAIMESKIVKLRLALIRPREDHLARLSIFTKTLWGKYEI